MAIFTSSQRYVMCINFLLPCDRASCQSELSKRKFGLLLITRHLLRAVFFLLQCGRAYTEAKCPEKGCGLRIGGHAHVLDDKNKKVESRYAVNIRFLARWFLF